MSENTLRVFKFYPLQSALRNLDQSRLKISTVQDLNDPFELRGVRMTTRDGRLAWEKMRRAVLGRYGFICFCRSWSNPVIWSHYADNHRGLCLGFDIPREFLIPVEYRKTRPVYSGILEETPSGALKKVTQALATKYKHWEYESEVRLLAALGERCPETGLYFKDFAEDLQLREVIIGSECGATSDEIRERAGDLPVITSRLAFKTYRVVRQLDPQRQK